MFLLLAWRYFTCFSSISTPNFEQVSVYCLFQIQEHTKSRISYLRMYEYTYGIALYIYFQFSLLGNELKVTLMQIWKSPYVFRFI